jgi:predicted acylesterase/phospholipase RssA
MDKNKIVISNSGGATKFISLIEGNRTLIEDFNVKPTDICGISSGAIAAIISAIGMIKDGLFKNAIQIGLTLKINQLFEVSPIKDNGSLKILNVLWRVLSGESSFGVQNIKHFFETTVNEKDFQNFQNSEITPNVWVMAVRPKDFKRGFWNLKDKKINYKTALKILSASAHIPIYSQPVQIDENDKTDLWLDGGLRNHNPSPKFIDMFGKNIETLYSLYTRKNQIDSNTELDWDKNVLTVLTRTMLGMLNEISKRDSQFEVLMSEKLGFNLKQFFYPSDILSSMYDTDETKLKQLYTEANNITKSLMF